MAISVGASELEVLLARIASRDTLAFNQFYDRTAAKIFSTILRILLERGESEDVLQDVYLIVWRKAAEYDVSRASPVTWVAAIARNRAIDRLRSRTRHPLIPIEPSAELRDESLGADEIFQIAVDAARLHSALATLKPCQAAAIHGCYFEGLTYVALAKREGLPIGTLKSWVRRGLIQLNAQLM